MSTIRFVFIVLILALGSTVLLMPLISRYTQERSRENERGADASICRAGMILFEGSPESTSQERFEQLDMIVNTCGASGIEEAAAVDPEIVAEWKTHRSIERN